MKNLMTRWLALGLVLVTLIVIIQGPSQVTEAKKIKIKKVLKELKKLKKYGYLLAYQRKKLYAIPFPMPLPIFVKRQHIYTTIPIIPRYIQHPQHSSSHGTSSYSSMASSSSETSAAASPPPSYETSMNMYMPESSSSSASYQSSPSKSSSYASSYGMPTRAKSKKYSLLDQSSYMSAIPSSSKYLSQLASALGQSSLSGSSTNKDLLSKIMNGQAKILAPTSLLSAIKGPSSALLNLYQQQIGSSTSSSSPSSGSSSSSSSSTSSSSHDDQDTKTGDHSSSSSSDETTGSSAVTKSHDSSSSPGEANKPSASEIHKSRYKPYMIRTPYGRMPPAAANMIASMNPAAVMGSGMMPPPPSPFAMMAAQSPALMQRIPMLQPANAQLMGASDYMPAVVYPVAGQMAASASDQLDSQSSDINENYAVPSESQQRDDELTRYRAGLMLQQRRQALLRLALLREREREMVESRGQQQPTTAQQIRAAQMLAYYRQQQQLRHLQQVHQLQQLHHHRQQLQQNTIDR